MKRGHRFKEWWVLREAEIDRLGAVGLAARLTLIYLVANPPGAWYLQFPVVALAMIGLIWGGLQTSKGFWMLMAYLAAARVAIGYWREDNHQFLFAYWCFALLISLWNGVNRDTLARNARYLIGLSFLFAMLWKAFLSPDFVRGDFFRAVLLKDPRFKEVSLLVGQAPETYTQNRAALRDMRQKRTAEAVMVEPPSQRRAAHLITWWTLLSESAVVLTFLAPLGSLPSRFRHWALLAFAWSTYAVATVYGFGWLLMILGVAQCEDRRRGTRLAYLATYGLILLYTLVPWTSWIVQALS